MTKSFLKTTWFLVSFIFLLFAFSEVVLADSTYYKKTMEQYTVPAVNLINQDGELVDLKAYLDSDKPIVLDFIYGTCTTICPILSVGFAHFQKKLGSDAQNVRMVSITIDPDNDTPELMKIYLEKYGARPGWEAFTGKRAHIVSVLREFDAYVANKMNHFPLTIMKAPGEKKWVRLYGMLSAADLRKEFAQLQGK